MSRIPPASRRRPVAPAHPFLSFLRTLGIALLLLALPGFLACGGGQGAAPPASPTQPPTPQTPVITAPATVVQGQSCQATTPSQAGMTFTWGISGGTVISGQGGAAVTLRADSVGTLTLSCVATNSANVASSVANATVNVQAPPRAPFRPRAPLRPWISRNGTWSGSGIPRTAPRTKTSSSRTPARSLRGPIATSGAWRKLSAEPPSRTSSQPFRAMRASSPAILRW